MITQSEIALMDDKGYRDAFVAGHVTGTIPHQIRSVRERLGLTQKEFAEKVGKPQSVISRLESSEYGRVNVQTLLDVAHGADVALIVKFASFPEFADAYADLSAGALAVADYSSSPISASAHIREPQPANVAVVHGTPTYHPFHIATTGARLTVVGVSVTPFVAAVQHGAVRHG